MQEFFTKERFKYEEIKLFLHRWDYKIEMSFDTKSNRTVAIEEVKKLKNDYNIVYRYDFTKNTKTTQHLMNMKEYNKLINLGTQHRSEESEKIDEEKVDKETL